MCRYNHFRNAAFSREVRKIIDNFAKNLYTGFEKKSLRSLKVKLAGICIFVSYYLLMIYNLLGYR